MKIKLQYSYALTFFLQMASASAVSLNMSVVFGASRRQERAILI
jgi:hypothetical protein